MASGYSRDPQTERSLRHSMRDGAAWSVMFGAGESYLQAFAVFLKASTAQISLLTALPALLGSVAQLAAGWIAGHRLTRRKPLILGGVLLQALTLLPIAALGFLAPGSATTWLLVCVALYYIGGQFASPPWSSLISDLVPERRRGRFFGNRTRLMSITTFAALGSAGIALEYFEKHALAPWGFALLFGIAFVARMYSAVELARMHEPARQLAPLELPPLRGLYRRLHGSDFARFALFVALMNLAVAVASPFFTLYMLRDLGFSYLEFTAVSAFYVLVQFVALKLWGRLSDVFGNRLILYITSMVFPVLPILWVALPNFWFILSIQMLGGVCWAGFSLAAGNFLYDVAPADKRAGYSAIHQTFANGAIFVGALLGGFLGAHAPTELTLGNWRLEFASGLWAALVFSGAARALVVATLLPMLREVRDVRHISASALVIRVTRANILAEWLFEFLPWRRKAPPKAAGPEIRSVDH